MNRTSFFRLFYIFAFAVSLLSFTFQDEPVWQSSGNVANVFQIGIDNGTGFNSKRSGTVRAEKAKDNEFGILKQIVNASRYKGCKIAMSAWVKTAEVKGRAGLWITVSRPDKPTLISYYNMEDRPIKGTTDWQKYEVKFSVPEEASTISFGAILVGTGQVWFDDVKFERIDKAEPFPESKDGTIINADFEK